MNYKQAKKLKELGFPQEGKGTYIDGEDCDICGHHCYYVPTLEEIIEELGDRFGSLERIRGYWTASGKISANEKIRTYLSKTPISALINLYIKINSK